MLNNFSNGDLHMVEQTGLFVGEEDLHLVEQTSYMVSVMAVVMVLLWLWLWYCYGHGMVTVAVSVMSVVMVLLWLWYGYGCGFGYGCNYVVSVTDVVMSGLFLFFKGGDDLKKKDFVDWLVELNDGKVRFYSLCNFHN
ncbi:hypothetical protein Tco_1388792, partial [Tanacetum coccineum]